MKFLLVSIAVFAALTKTLEGQQPVVEELTDDTFESYLTVSQLAIVDFYATWCPYCKTFAPIYLKAATKALESKLNIFFAKVNCAGSGKNICKKLNVKFLPTVRVFRDGKPLGDYEGKRTSDAVLAFAQKASSAPNDLKMTMSDDISDPHKIPSNVTPWHADDTEHH
ncbi:hypothetical protein OS493_024861 [Desmophyllum pertusum]|uniref:Thioredoxin domain-containing protein n=1 Tax=Desmophyllum pertusum TaxID=174260 RepID=A0A9W9YXY5_9CNID|nr:hypothetical protein OS493_024861 [Desmophyllum pertusum]